MYYTYIYIYAKIILHFITRSNPIKSNNYIMLQNVELINNLQSNNNIDGISTNCMW